MGVQFSLPVPEQVDKGRAPPGGVRRFHVTVKPIRPTRDPDCTYCCYVNNRNLLPPARRTPDRTGKQRT
jgi:hypothetical protein